MPGTISSSASPVYFRPSFALGSAVTWALFWVMDAVVVAGQLMSYFALTSSATVSLSMNTVLLVPTAASAKRPSALTSKVSEPTRPLTATVN